MWDEFRVHPQSTLRRALEFGSSREAAHSLSVHRRLGCARPSLGLTRHLAREARKVDRICRPSIELHRNLRYHRPPPPKALRGYLFQRSTFTSWRTGPRAFFTHSSIAGEILIAAIDSAVHHLQCKSERADGDRRGFGNCSHLGVLFDWPLLRMRYPGSPGDLQKCLTLLDGRRARLGLVVRHRPGQRQQSKEGWLFRPPGPILSN